MSAGNEISGEVGRLNEKLMGVDPSLMPFVLDISDIYDSVRQGELISFTDEQLEYIGRRLEVFSAIVATERARRQQPSQLDELFDSPHGPIHLATVVNLPAHTVEHEEPAAIPEPMDDSPEEQESFDPAETGILGEAQQPIGTGDESSVPDEPIQQTDAAEDNPSIKAADEPEATSMPTEERRVLTPEEAETVRKIVEERGLNKEAEFILGVFVRNDRVLSRQDFDGYGFALIKEGRSASANNQAFSGAMGTLIKLGFVERVGRYEYKLSGGKKDNHEIEEAPDSAAAIGGVALQQDVEVPTPVESPEVSYDASSTADSVEESIRILKEQLPVPEAAEDLIPMEQTKPLPEATTEPVHASEIQEAPDDDPEIIIVSNKGLGVRFADNGTYEIVLDGNTVGGFEDFGNIPALTLIGLALRIYGDETNFRELAERVERLGEEVEYAKLNTLLNRMKSHLTIGSQELLKKGKNDSWSLSFSVNFDREQCMRILARFGFDEKQANRFLA